MCKYCEMEAATQRCSRCKTSWYCSADCQLSDWSFHKTQCKPAQIQGVIIHDEEARKSQPDGRIFESITIDKKHPIHKEGVIPSSTAAYGVPLMVYRLKPYSVHELEPENRVATNLMVDKVWGMPPFDWEHYVGTVIVIRKDGSPLTPEGLECLWKFHESLLKTWNERPNDIPPKLTKYNLDDFCRTYRLARIRDGQERFRGLELPL
ncbi:hypothetical protein BDN72DRAFT_763512 [Pluteus cervinus]|uniref:Uncharacterized protein n=1 Tax=Pluteus cervinus TaxID=181527 RepID=A0ACD3B3U3_9AGAR|nr:hypothetical protein BDN72DRAFT_763512 [Pluteus cervinus]